MDGPRTRKNPTKKKVLLSIVDPWDVRVASVDPLGLAARRGISIDDLEIARPSVPGPTSSSYSSRTPWPWYKPSLSPAPTQTRRVNEYSTAPANEDKLAALAPADVSIKPLRVKDGEQQRKNDGKKRYSSAQSPVQLIARNYGNATPKSLKAANNGETEEKRNEALLFLDDLGAKSHARDELTSVDESCRENRVQVRKINGAVVEENGQINDKSLVCLIEELVHARYNPAPIIRRKFQKKPLFPRSINHTDTLHGERNNSSEDKEEHPIGNIRKISSSMPTKLVDMDQLRIGNEKSVSSKFARHESDSSETFSNSGSTLNGSTLGSETEDEDNDEESSKYVSPKS